MAAHSGRGVTKSDDGSDFGFKYSLKEFITLIKNINPKLNLFFIGVLFLIMSSSIQVYVPKLASGLINQFKQELDIKMLFLMAFLLVSTAVTSAIGGTVLGIFGEELIKKLRQELWYKLTTLKISYFDSVKAGEVASRLTNDTDKIKQFLAVSVPQTIANILIICGSVYMMLMLDWHMSLAMFTAIPLMMILIMPIMSFGTRISYIRQDAMSYLTGAITEILSEIRLVKVSNAEEEAQKSAAVEIEKIYKAGRKEAKFDAMMQPIIMMITMFIIFGLLAYGIHRIAIGDMTIAILMSFLMYLFNIIGTIPIIANLFSELAKATGSTKRVRELLNEQSENFGDGELLDLSGRTLKVKNLGFAYPDSPNELILKDISFEAKPNEIVAFVGPSGGGKSTIFSMVERFYQPTKGKIAFDNTYIENIELANYRSQIGFVSQDSSIISGTIRFNLTYGLKENFTDEELWEILDLAYAEAFVREMPKQLDTDVGERGIKISVGQRQRIAIARALLRNPKLLMLDEVTASLDSESEIMVQKALEKLMFNRTTLIIAHRLSTIAESDRIYFVENGKITGAGKHATLISSHPTYAKYVSEQFKSS